MCLDYLSLYRLKVKHTPCASSCRVLLRVHTLHHASMFWSEVGFRWQQAEQQQVHQPATRGQLRHFYEPSCRPSLFMFGFNSWWRYKQSDIPLPVTAHSDNLKKTINWYNVLINAFTLKDCGHRGQRCVTLLSLSVLSDSLGEKESRSFHSLSKNDAQKKEVKKPKGGKDAGHVWRDRTDKTSDLSPSLLLSACTSTSGGNFSFVVWSVCVCVYVCACVRVGLLI